MKTTNRHNLERVVFGSILFDALDTQSVDMRGFSADDFTEPICNTLYNGLLSIKQPIDIITLGSHTGIRWSIVSGLAAPCSQLKHYALLLRDMIATDNKKADFTAKLLQELKAFNRADAVDIITKVKEAI